MLGPYRRVLRALRAHVPALAAGAVAVVTSRALMVWAPLLLRDALKALEEGGPDTLARASAAAYAFLGVSVAAGFFTWAQRRLLIGASRHVERALKEDLFGHLQRLPIATFDRTRAGDLLSRLTSDVEAVRWVIGPGPMYVSSTLVLFPLAAAAMLSISVEVSLLALAPLLLIALVVRDVTEGGDRGTISIVIARRHLTVVPRSFLQAAQLVTGTSEGKHDVVSGPSARHCLFEVADCLPVFPL